MWDYSDTYILVNEAIAITADGAGLVTIQKSERNEKVMKKKLSTI